MTKAAIPGRVEAVVLHLVLTHHWFDEMIAGRKWTEYRKVTPHWTRLIWDRRDKITHARFSRGYTAQRIIRRVEQITIGPCPYDGWPGQYYRIDLGEVRVENDRLHGRGKSDSE